MQLMSKIVCVLHVFSRSSNPTLAGENSYTVDPTGLKLKHCYTRIQTLLKVRLCKVWKFSSELRS